MNTFRTLVKVHGTRVFDNLNEMLSLLLSSHANPSHFEWYAAGLIFIYGFARTTNTHLIHQITDYKIY